MIDFARRLELKCGAPSNDNIVDEANPDKCILKEGLGTIDVVTVCESEHFWSSGAHRVIFSGIFRELPYVVAVEEVETGECVPLTDAVYIGIDNALVLNLDYTKLLKSLVYASTGVELYLNTNNRKEEIRFHFMPRDDLYVQGCKLSEEANHCFLNSIADWWNQ